MESATALLLNFIVFNQVNNSSTEPGLDTTAGCKEIESQVDESYRGAVPGVSERLADDSCVLAREPVVAHAAPGSV